MSYRDIEEGDRVELVRTNDNYTRLRPGDRGTFRGAEVIDAIGDKFTQIDVKWDDGSRLMLIPEEGDSLKKITETEGFIAEWYTHLVDVGATDPTTLYGYIVIEATDKLAAGQTWEDLLDVDFFGPARDRSGKPDRGVYTLVPGAGMIAFDTNDLPDEWNFEEIVLVDLQELYEEGL